MNCDAIEELLSDLIDDELPAATRAGVEAHIVGCPQCATAYRQLRRTVRFVRANASASLVHGTPGGAYAEFTRALADPAYGHSGVDLMTEYIKPDEPAEGVD